MSQRERIEWINPCPLTPSSKRSLEPQGIKMRLNLHPGIPILVVFILALILMASSLEIFWMLILMLIPGEWLPSIHGFPTPELDLLTFASVIWILVITLLAGLIVNKLIPDSLNRSTLVTVSLALILMISGLLILWMLRFNVPSTGHA